MVPGHARCWLLTGEYRSGLLACALVFSVGPGVYHRSPAASLAATTLAWARGRVGMKTGEDTALFAADSSRSVSVRVLREVGPEGALDSRRLVRTAKGGPSCMVVIVCRWRISTVSYFRLAP